MKKPGALAGQTFGGNAKTDCRRDAQLHRQLHGEHAIAGYALVVALGKAATALALKILEEGGNTDNLRSLGDGIGVADDAAHVKIVLGGK